MMSITNTLTFEIRKELSELIGDVSAKGVFNSYGIFQEKSMFGLFQDNYFYLRAVGKLAQYLESQGAIPYMEHSEKPVSCGINFYLLPDKIRENKDLYKSVVLWSIEQIEEDRNQKEMAKVDLIRGRVNLSVRHERLLNKIGIRSFDDFLKAGAEYCYIALKKAGVSVNLSFFWNLKAASLRKHSMMLTQEEKEKALEALNTALAKEGMRAIDPIKD
ncbi:TfoX/Sxy family DNA transformation protein [Avibacterium endocarditidis]|uniref:TfoX/Sxy family DNA transformation protein n=1 Tax=Avibacterium endocarditidis TaxID=380674 RepID=UPI0039F0982C